MSDAGKQPPPDEKKFNHSLFSTRDEIPDTIKKQFLEWVQSYFKDELRIDGLKYPVGLNSSIDAIFNNTPTAIQELQYPSISGTHALVALLNKLKITVSNRTQTIDLHVIDQLEMIVRQLMEKILAIKDTKKRPFILKKVFTDILFAMTTMYRRGFSSSEFRQRLINAGVMTKQESDAETKRITDSKRNDELDKNIAVQISSNPKILALVTELTERLNESEAKVKTLKSQVLELIKERDELKQTITQFKESNEDYEKHGDHLKQLQQRLNEVNKRIVEMAEKFKKRNAESQSKIKILYDNNAEYMKRAEVSFTGSHVPPPQVDKDIQQRYEQNKTAIFELQQNIAQNQTVIDMIINAPEHKLYIQDLKEPSVPAPVGIVVGSSGGDTVYGLPGDELFKDEETVPRGPDPDPDEPVNRRSFQDQPIDVDDGKHDEPPNESLYGIAGPSIVSGVGGILGLGVYSTVSSLRARYGTMGPKPTQSPYGPGTPPPTPPPADQFTSTGNLPKDIVLWKYIVLILLSGGLVWLGSDRISRLLLAGTAFLGTWYLAGPVAALIAGTVGYTVTEIESKD